MNETLLKQAQERIDDLGFNEQEQEFIFSDWPEGDEHLRWLLTASGKEIRAWGEAANWGTDPEQQASALVKQAMSIIGSIRSEKKSAAVRENGRKGGRPRNTGLD